MAGGTKTAPLHYSYEPLANEEGVPMLAHLQNARYCMMQLYVPILIHPTIILSDYGTKSIEYK